MTGTKLISIAGASAALLYWLASNSAPASSPEHSASAPREARSAAPVSAGSVDEVARLRGEVFQLRAKTAEIAESSRADQTPESAEDRAVAKEQWIERAHEVLGEHFTADRIDPTWAEETETEFEQFFAGEVPGSVTLQALECHGELCRLELTCAGPAAIAEFTRSVMTAPPWNRTLQMLPGGDGHTGIVYVARRGHDLPAVAL